MADNGRQSAFAITLIVIAAALVGALGVLVWTRGRPQAEELAATVAALQTQVAEPDVVVLIPTPLVVTATPTPSPVIVVATPTPDPASPVPAVAAPAPSPVIVVATPTPNPASPTPAVVGGGVAAPPTPVRLVVKADARLPWQDTKAIVLAGQRLRIQVVDGSWTHWKGTVPYQRGEGTGYICGRAACVEPMPEVGNGSLIGRIGSQMFPIGNATELTAAQSGTLFLAINDGFDGLRDNDGVLTVEVTIGGER